MYKSNRDIQDMIKKGLYNRLATVFFYLSDVEEGGQTNFPRAGGRPQPRDFADCSKGVSVFPRRGRIMIFYSMHPSGEMDETSLHAGCAVKRGTKWSANKWILGDIGDALLGLPSSHTMHLGHSILKAFADGYCATDATKPPQAQELVVNAQALAGATRQSSGRPFVHRRGQQACAARSRHKPAADRTDHTRDDFAQLTSIQIRGGFPLDSLNLGAMLSSASSLQVLDLSGSEFGDADAQLLAAANVGPLPELHLLGFRACKLQSPAAAAALARAVNHFGSIRHIRMQANRWRVEAHRSFAEHLLESSAQALVSLEAGYSSHGQQGQALASQSLPSRTADPNAGTAVESLAEELVEGADAPATESRSDKLHFLAQFGVGLWLSAVACRLASGLQELRLEKLDVGVVALQILRRRLRSRSIAAERCREKGARGKGGVLPWLAFSTGCTGLSEKKAGIELAWLVARVTPRLQRLVLAGSDASPSLVQGMLEAISRSPVTTAERALTHNPFAVGRPEVRHLCWIDVENAGP
eukprot:s573_g11.t1